LTQRTESGRVCQYPGKTEEDRPPSLFLFRCVICD
jgi:hypothetical protein